MNFRTHLLAFAFAAIGTLAAPSAAHAQVGVNVQIGQPAWGPAVPQGTQYYYIPEIDGYYDLAARNYIVLRNGRWVPVAALPGYDPYRFHPVVVNDYRGRQPWTRYNDYHARYYRPVAPRPVVVQRPVIVQRPVVQQRVVERQVIVRDRNGRDRDRRDDRGRGRDRY